MRLWNVEDGACLAIFTEHRECVTQLVFSLDCQVLCSGADDGTVEIRRLRETLGLEW